MSYGPGMYSLGLYRLYYLILLSAEDHSPIHKMRKTEAGETENDFHNWEAEANAQIGQPVNQHSP